MSDKTDPSDEPRGPAGEDRPAGRFAYRHLDRIVHEPSRLSILASLAAHPDGLLFADLKSLCALTDGNLSRQLQLLQAEGAIEIWKGFRGKRPQTLCRMTPQGRRRFADYISALEAVVADAAADERSAATRGRGRSTFPRGFSPA